MLLVICENPDGKDAHVIRWRKSTYSGSEGGSCVEVAHTRDCVRDSKNVEGPILRIDQLVRFVEAVKADQFSL